MGELKKSYDGLIGDYMKLFFDKENFYDTVKQNKKNKRIYPSIEWIGEIGGLCEFSDYYFNFTDLKYCVDHDIPNGVIFEWYDTMLEYGSDNYTYVNLERYCVGDRPQLIRKKYWPTNTFTWYKLRKLCCIHKWVERDFLDTCDMFVCSKCSKMKTNKHK